MSPAHRLLAPAMWLLLAVALGLAAGGGPAWSGSDQRPASAPWEYTTTGVETASLQSKLSELGLAGWDVFSVERSGTVIEEQPNATARLVTDTFQVTARRPLKP